MAKKKVEFVAEVPEKEEAPEIDYKETHEAKLEDIVGAPPEEPKIEEPVIPEVKEEKPPFDAEKLKEEISEATAKKIIEATTQQKEPKKEVDEELISPWAKEGRAPKDYEEVADWGVEKKSILDRREREAELLKQQETAKQTEEYNKQQVADFNKYTDDQLGDLKAAGKIKTPEEQRALFQSMLDVNIARQKEGKAPIYSIKEIFYEHYKAPTAQPAGADAPISPGTGALASEGKEMDYKDLQPGVPFAQWLANSFRK
jgi:hypothetical protein